MPDFENPVPLFREVARYQQILGVLVKNGFGELLDQIHIWEHTSIEKHIFRHQYEQHAQIAHYTFPQRVLAAFVELGPTFIKFGQMMASRPDLFSADLVFELQKLFDQVNFLPQDVIKSAIETELKHPLSDSFSSFDDKPLGAASLAQVHKAVLLSGETVAIKIQRPDIEKLIETDLAIIRSIFVLLEKHLVQARLINLVSLVDEFAQDLKRELDFIQEKNNMKHFARNFAEYPAVYVPKVYDNLCTERMIIMEYLHGIGITDTDRLIEEHYDPRQVAIHGINIMLKSILELGFFHADPHPGNMFVLPGNVIGLIDFGMMSSISHRNRLRLIRLLYSIWTGDEKKIAESVDELMEAESLVSPDELEEGVAGILNKNIKSSGKIALAPVLFDLIKLISSHKVPFNRNLLWITKSMAMLESISTTLMVDLDIIDYAKVYAYKTILNQMDPTHEASSVLFWMSDIMGFLEDFPREAKLLFKQLTRGKTQIEFRHVGLDPFVNKIARTINYLSMVMFIGILLLTSALLVLAGIPPRIWNIPVAGFVGLMLALLMMLVLFYMVVFKRK